MGPKGVLKIFSEMHIEAVKTIFNEDGVPEKSDFFCAIMEFAERVASSGIDLLEEKEDRMTTIERLNKNLLEKEKRKEEKEK